jgi:hypothetical protein
MPDREIVREILVRQAPMPVAFSELTFKAPARGQSTCEFLPVVERERQIAWRMALAATRSRVPATRREKTSLPGWWRW